MIRLTNLEKLIFKRNSLVSLDSGGFRNLGKLEVADFHDNRIAEIQDGAFQGLQSLKGLDLSLNIVRSAY